MYMAIRIPHNRKERSRSKLSIYLIFSEHILIIHEHTHCTAMYNLDILAVHACVATLLLYYSCTVETMSGVMVDDTLLGTSTFIYLKRG